MKFKGSKKGGSKEKAITKEMPATTIAPPR